MSLLLVQTGLCQGCFLSIILFMVFMERISRHSSGNDPLPAVKLWSPLLGPSCFYLPQFCNISKCTLSECLRSSTNSLLQRFWFHRSMMAAPAPLLSFIRVKLHHLVFHANCYSLGTRFVLCLSQHLWRCNHVLLSLHQHPSFIIYWGSNNFLY